MKPSRLLPLFLATGLLNAGCGTALSVLPDCRYDSYSSPELLFVLPTLEQYATQQADPPFYLGPDRDRPLRMTSFSYSNHFAGHRYRAIGTVPGADGPYQQWLLDDCRLLYTPLDRP